MFTICSSLTNDPTDGELSGTISDSFELCFTPEGSSDLVPSKTLG